MHALIDELDTYLYSLYPAENVYALDIACYANQVSYLLWRATLLRPQSAAVPSSSNRNIAKLSGCISVSRRAAKVWSTC